MNNEKEKVQNINPKNYYLITSLKLSKNNKIEIRISGMSCTGCENRVENVLKNIENVESL